MLRQISDREREGEIRGKEEKADRERRRAGGGATAPPQAQPAKSTIKRCGKVYKLPGDAREYCKGNRQGTAGGVVAKCCGCSIHTYWQPG